MFPYYQEGHEAELEERERHVQQLQSEIQQVQAEVRAKDEQIEATDDHKLQLQNDIASKNSQLETLARQMEVKEMEMQQLTRPQVTNAQSSIPCAYILSWTGNTGMTFGSKLIEASGHRFMPTSLNA